MEESSEGVMPLTADELGQLISKRRDKRAGQNGHARIPRRPASESDPLSFAQQRLWFLEQLEPLSTVNNMPAAVRLRGNLQTAALAQTLTEIERRHEMLRTAILADTGEPVQKPSAKVFELPQVDLSGVSTETAESVLSRLADEEAQRQFDLTNGRLWRVRLIRLSRTEHVLVLVMHHIASDAWSVGVLFRELATLYRNYCSGAPSELPELPIQYADYAVWQRNWMQGAVVEKQLSYWRGQLQGAPAVLALPTDRPRSQRRSYAGARTSMQLSPTLTEALRELGQREGVTPFMLFLAAFVVVLGRYSGQTDVCVGTPVANRNRAEVEGLIGFFVNTLVMRVELGGEVSFRQLLKRVREVALDAYAHQDLPFERLVREFQLERTTHSPLFQVMFSVMNLHVESLELPDLSLSSWEPNNRVTRFDLALNVSHTQSEMMASIDYRTDLFDATTIARIILHFQLMLEQMAREPDKRIVEIPILTEVERQQLLVEWSDTRTDAGALAIHETLQLQAQRSPHAIAVVFEGLTLTYQELNERANRLARYLQRLGAGREMRVAVCLDRSLEMVVSLLAVFKAGAAFVPLDPDYPQERLAFMVQDAQASVLVTQSSLAQRLPAHAASTVYLDSSAKDIDEESCEALNSSVSLQDLAYVIYTSGSTGKPKGVMVEHGNLVSCLGGMQEVLQMNSSDAIPCIASFSFDIFLFEMFHALLLGGRVMLLTKEHVLDLPRLARTVEDVTFIHALPGLMGQLLNYIEANGLRDNYTQVRCALVGGDQVPPELLGRMQDLFSNARIVEAYGPTETAIICSLNPVNDLQSLQRHVIGRPLRGAIMRLYDSQRNPVPLGVPGEIYIGGSQVSRGYLGRDELTARQFITLGSQRFYRTGDLGRYLPDGRLEFMGRADQQVKIRGFRIELEEVESMLRQHENVLAAVVVAREDVPGDKHLVAYLVPRSQVFNGVVTELRSFLRQRLPEFMIPAAFVLLDALPLTAHHKVDRDALPAPASTRPDLEVSFVAPRDDTERTVAEIWAELLGIERVGVDDNFFQLGGHSLLATQVASRVCEVFQVQIPLRDFFDAPTVAHLALTIKQGLESQPEIPQSRIEAIPRHDDDLDQLLEEIDQLSEAEVQQLLAMEQESPGH
ncbi:MAG TPA: amino acid adenylation domain-containing protein [Pyrinomonadaceae bacterium]